MSMPASRDAELTWGVGSVADRLGLPASTLRTWERRYGVGPSSRTEGGHRRYTQTDIQRVTLAKLLIDRGAPPADATRLAHTLDEVGLAAALAAERRGDPDDVPDAEGVVADFLAAATGDDGARVAVLVATALRQRGVVGAWTEVIAPALVRVGEEWAAGRLGIEAEHLASEAVVGELRAHTRAHADVDRGRATIVLASAEDDQHSLPLLALEAALAELGLGTHLLGGTFPAAALAALAQRVGPDVVFLWASLPRPADDPVWAVLDDIAARSHVVLGGPGWPREVVGRHGLTRSSDLQDAVDRVAVRLPTGNLRA